MRRIIQLNIVGLIAFLVSNIGLAEDMAFKISGKKTSVKELYKDNESAFYELEKQKYELIEKLAKEKYLESFWGELAAKQKVSTDMAKKNYLAKKAAVGEKEINDALKRFKDHPRLKDLSETDRKKQVIDYLNSVKTREVIDSIVSGAINSKKLVITYPQPKEPVFEISVVDTDPIKYGPNPEDTKPLGCVGTKCAITVVEYSEFQCPFCERVLPSVRKLLEEYKGKVRWIVRDFPLGFHNRAKPAAVAARCALEQGKYWQMYDELFKNQRSLEDRDLQAYAKNIGLNMAKYEKCFGSPNDKMKIIDDNYRSGEKLGVTGTPAFFINGRRLSGALPYGEFKRVFEEELRN